MNDIFDGQPNKCIIVQQVNCQGIIDSGLAKAIYKRYPQVYEHHRVEYELGLLELGYASYIEVATDKYIANICGQPYGIENKGYTDYNALFSGLMDVKTMAKYLNTDVVIPYHLGCSLNRGSWDIVLSMIEEIFKGDIVAYIYHGGNENYEQKERKCNNTKFVKINEQESIQDF